MSTEAVSGFNVNTGGMEDTQIAHLAGFFDGRGDINVAVSKDSDYKIGYQYQPRLRLPRPQRENDPVLGKVMAYAEENHVNSQIRELSQGDGEPSNLWYCNRPDSIARFLEPMLEYMVTQFEPAVIMLEEVLPRIEDGKHLEKQGFIELMGYADKIRETTHRQQQSKYDQEYFQDLWSLAQ